MRDRNLDIYRGAIMIYITCFCHLIWWEGVKVGIFEGSWITGIFFAMATVFYIVGASFSLSLEKPFRTYLKGRIKESRSLTGSMHWFVFRLLCIIIGSRER